MLFISHKPITGFVCLLVLSVAFPALLTAQPFEVEDKPSLRQLVSRIAWGDFDGDGDMDFYAVDGISPHSAYIYLNEGNFSFNKVKTHDAVPLPIRPFDFDGDGDLDVYENGRIYRNNPLDDGTPNFKELHGVNGAEPYRWGDFDNDGDSDLLDGGSIRRQTEEGVWQVEFDPWFNTQLSNKTASAFFDDEVIVNDYDQDGDLDILRFNSVNPIEERMLIRQINPLQYDTAFVFTNEGRNLRHISWNDFDTDGRTDVLIYADDMSWVYLNRGDTFEQVPISLPGSASVDVGDMDQDGDLDIVAGSSTETGLKLMVLTNQGDAVFDSATHAIPVPPSGVVSMKLVDIDTDGDLDVYATFNLSSSDNTLFIRNRFGGSNENPTVPTGLQSVVQNDRANLSWEPATDTETPAEALAYRVRIGTEPGLSDVLPSQSNLETGKALIDGDPRWTGISRFIRNLPAGTYYWSVQSMDLTGNTSAFSPEASFESYGPPPPDFEQVDSGVDFPFMRKAEWGDYDADGDLDLLLGDQARLIELYRNDEGTFTFVDFLASSQSKRSEQDAFASKGITAPVFVNRFTWSDPDNDGDLDILLSNHVFLNEGDDVFSLLELEHSIEGGCLYSADYDRDGRMDFLTSSGITKNYGNLAHMPTLLVLRNTFAIEGETCGWQDIDEDGDIDYLGNTESGNNLNIYRQNALGEFVAEGPLLEEFLVEDHSWGDYDSDGDADLLIKGRDFVLGHRVAHIFRNDDGDLVHADDLLPATYVRVLAVKWVDYDGDGDLDASIASVGKHVILENNEGVFTEANVVFSKEELESTPVWGDIDRDGMPDYLSYGNDLANGFRSEFYMNRIQSENLKPNVPGGLTSTVSGDKVTLSWQGAFDAHTPPEGLTYDVTIGILPGGTVGDFVRSYVAEGEQQLPRLGNAGYATSIEIQGLSNRPYFWHVRAIDPAGKVSGFATASELFQITESPVTSFVATSIPGVPFSNKMNWGDYDADGDYDLIVVAEDSVDGESAFRLYQNRRYPLYFSEVDVDLPASQRGTSAWGDYDNDGDLDVAFNGEYDEGRGVQIWRNDGRDTFVDLGILFYGNNHDFDQVSWVDFDNDGDLDVYAGANRFLVNQDSVFVGVETNMPSESINGGALDDIDLDGDFDIHFSNHVYLNQQGVFGRLDIDFPVSLTGHWWDYDTDGDPDLYMGGGARLYNNNSGVLTESSVAFPIIVNSEVEVGDFTNNGRPDLLTWGGSFSTTPRQGAIVSFNGSTIDFMYPGLPLVNASEPKGLDFFGSNRLDAAFLVQGFGLIIYNRSGGGRSIAPAAPTGLEAEVDASTVRLQWDRATDAETPSEALRYNLRVGTTPGGQEVKTPMVHSQEEQLLVPGYTNAGQGTSWTLRSLPEGTYDWSVQTMDASYVVSPFAQEQTFTISNSDLAVFAPEELGLKPSATGNTPLRIISPQDIEPDGDLDVLILDGDGRGQFAQVFLQDNGVLVDSVLVDPSEFGNMQDPQWGDYDNDGDPDLLSSAYELGTFNRQAQLFRNDAAAAFTKVILFSDSLSSIQSTWIDIDNDGDLDIASVGVHKANGKIAFMYENVGSGEFEYRTLNLPGLIGCAISTADYDVDGDSDLLVAGCLQGLVLYNNTGGTFEPINIYSEPTYNRVSWGDYDQDGDPDIVFFYNNGGVVLRNDREAGFVNVFDFSMVFGTERSIHWADLNNDGWLDIIAGNTGHSRAFINNQDGTFSLSPFLPPIVDTGAIAWGDFDGDQDTDLFLPAVKEGGLVVVELYRNEGPMLNTPPAAPTALRHEVRADTVWLSWDPAIDGQTASPGLTYDLQVGTAPGGHDVMSAVSASYRPMGNVGYNTRWPLVLPADQTYQWQIRAVDPNFASSEFAIGESFSIEESSSGTDNDDARSLPTHFRSNGNYPNPFTSSTTVLLDVPQESEVTVVVFDMIGREVYRTTPMAIEAGWGQRVALNLESLRSGTYLYRIHAESFGSVHRLNGRFVMVGR